MTEIDEKARFEIELASLSGETSRLYYKFLAERRSELVNEAPSHRANVPIEERKSILDRARRMAQYGNVDAEKMAKNWDRYNLRPPIGGAQDD